jgi:hypothetical protein
MELYLTLTIALGGIATGIGAMLTATVARRQFNQQRKFLQDQAVVARRQMELAEEGLGEQRRSLEEQNERARSDLEADLMYKLRREWASRTYQDYRRKSLQYVNENYLVDDELLEVQYLDGATIEIFNFFDEIGYLTRTGVLPIERVVNAYGGPVRLGWALWEPAVKNMREEWAAPSRFMNFEYLHHQGLDLDRKRGGTGAPPTKEQLRHFLEAQQRTEAEVHSAVSVKEPAERGEKPTEVMPP